MHSSNGHDRKFWRSVASVLTGTVLSQLIPILGSLFLTRLFAPAAFGEYSVWIAAVIFLAVLVTGRFETALAIEADGEARRLAMYSVLGTILLGTVGVGVLGATVVSIQPDWFPMGHGILMALVLPASSLNAAAQTWQSWAAAEGKYKALSIMRIVQATAITSLQVAAGVFYDQAETLAAAYILGVLLGLLLSTRLLRLGSIEIPHFAQIVREFWSRNRRFIYFSLPADAVNTAAGQLPVLIVANRFGAETAGFLALTIRVLGAPIGLLGLSVLDVFKRHAAAGYRERGECRSEYIQTFKVLSAGSLLFCIAVVASAEPIFVIAFGEGWRLAGTIAVWLLPLFALRFMASPLSYIVYIAGKQHVDLVWQAALLFVTILSLYIPATYEQSLQIYSAGYSMLYVVYLMMSYRFSLGDKG